LDASLDALGRGFSPWRAGWFSRFHELLQPTLPERAARAERYADLLTSPVAPTVSMAIRALESVQNAGLLDAGLLVDRIEPVMFAPAAATVRTALGMLARAAEAAPDQSAAAMRLAAIALEHPKADVQKAGLDLIERNGFRLDDDVKAAINARLAVVSPSLRPRLVAVLSQATAEARPAPPAGGGESAVEPLKQAASALPDDLRRLAGVDAALSALETLADDVPRAVFDGMDVPRLAVENRVVPIATFEEFIDEALVAIEHPEDLDRVERVLAAALRFAADRPVDDTVLLSPLAKALRRYKPQQHSGGGCWATPRGALQIVLQAFTAASPIQFDVSETDPRAAMVLRTDAMAHAIRARQRFTQLSAPTHRGFWIDPEILVERSRAATADGPAPSLGIADQCLALLRLAPDRRAEALGVARILGGEWGAALRYALGGDETFGKTASLWVAAARARAPFDPDPQIAVLLGKSMMGADLPPNYHARVAHKKFTNKYRDKIYNCVSTRIDLLSHENTCSNPAEGHAPSTSVTLLNSDLSPNACLTTMSLCDPRRIETLNWYLDEARVRIGTWAPTLWPQHPDPVFALASKAACMRDGRFEDRPPNVPVTYGLTLILDPDVPVSPMALFMLCRGLNGIDAATTQATIDALIVLIDDGRLDGDTLGAAMHEFLMSGLVCGKRWPDRLRQVASTSPLALLVIRRALERALHSGQPQIDLQDLHAWIECLYELCAEACEAVWDPAARNGIQTLAKAGKSKTAARSVLALDFGPNHRLRRDAAHHALSHRIKRAGRWMANVSSKVSAGG
ncbi:MAG: DUF6493 family protein, partial [Alsobacter sp.]